MKLRFVSRTLLVAGLSVAAALAATMPALAGVPVLTHLKDYVPDEAAAVERRGTCLSLDEKTLYLAGLQDKALYAFDVASGTMKGSVSLAEISADAYGKAVAVGPDGDVWTPNCTILELYRFSKDLAPKGTYSMEDLGVAVVEGVVVGKGSELFIPDRKNKGGVHKALVSGAYLKADLAFGKSGFAEGGAEERQLAAGADGSIYAGDFSASTIYRIDGKTGKSSVFSSKVPKPYHLAADASGRVYVAQYDGPTSVTILAADGTILGSYSKEDLGLEERSSGIAVNAAGTRLYVVDQKTAENGGIVRSYSVAF